MKETMYTVGIDSGADYATGGVLGSFGNITLSFGPTTPKSGDRIRVKSGYADAGKVGILGGKSVTKGGRVHVKWDDGSKACVLADAIEAYPYTREERIERAIEDYVYATGEALCHNTAAVLRAILDAGV